MKPHSANRVLLVGLEDIVEELKGKLLYQGTTFEAATTGEEALEKARVTRFSRIILDVDALDMDGIETARKLREMNSGVKIWLVSGLDRFDECIEALEIGLEEIIMKPLKVDELLNLLGASTSL